MKTFTFSFRLLATLFVLFGASTTFAGESNAPTPKDSSQLIILVPESFKGWGCVDFGVVGAPPLHRERNAVIVRFHTGESVATSTKLDEIFNYPQVWVEMHGKRGHLPNGIAVQDQISSYNPEPSVDRACYFIGSEEDVYAAGNPPGFEDRPPEAKPISLEERQALIALYNATDGKHWTHRVGWLDAPGTECKWRGVECRTNENGQATVFTLELTQNNLVGTVPNEIAHLTNLENLSLYGNHLSGRLPDTFIQRWLADTFWLVADAPLLTDFSEIEYEVDSTSLLCGYERTILRADGTVTRFATRCRKASPKDRTTFCEVRQGRVLPEPFAKLAVLIEKNGFFDLDQRYERSITDSAEVTTRVTRNGKVFVVSNYAASGPFRLWEIHRAIEGVASTIYWEKTTKLSKCPEGISSRPLEQQ